MQSVYRLIGLSVLLAGLGASAQERRGFDLGNDLLKGRYQDRDREGGYDRRYNEHRAPLQRVRADLHEAIREVGYLSEDDRRRFFRVREGIVEFQRDWERGRYDRRALSEVIHNLESLVERGNLSERDCEILAEDAQRLREMWERMDRRNESSDKPSTPAPALLR